MIHIERSLVEGTCTRSAEVSGYAGRWDAEGVLPLLIPGESDVGFAAVGILRARPPDVHQFFMIEIVVFNPAHAITALVRGTNAQRILRVVLPDVFIPGKKLDRVQGILGSDDYPVVVGHDAIYG